MIEAEPIIRGVTVLNPDTHVSTGRYAALGADVEVIEVSLGVALPHHDGRVAAFTRLISSHELSARWRAYQQDPETFIKQQANSLGGNAQWEK